MERSLEPYLRGNVWWVRGTRPDTDRYIRESLGTSDPAIAEAKVEEIYRRARQRRILGPDAPQPQDELTFAACVLLYPARAKDATYLKPIVRRCGRMLVRDMTPEFIRGLGRQMMPRASTDTWQRQIVTPARSVINHAHDLGKCPPIRIRRFSEKERIAQDQLRGRESRIRREPGSWDWLLAFMEHADPRDAALAHFMFRHGYRISQSLAMTRSRDMDLANRRVRVHAAKGHPAHWVELDLEEVVMIANLPLPYRGAARDRVFGIGGGRSGALYARWKAACAKAGIAYIAPHAAGRHGFGTEMIVRQGVDPVTAADGRWSDPSVMLKTYAHPEDSEAAVRAAFRAGRTLAVQARAKGSRKALARKTK